jgi:hypothetical protein
MYNSFPDFVKSFLVEEVEGRGNPWAVKSSRKCPTGFIILYISAYKFYASGTGMTRGGVF